MCSERAQCVATLLSRRRRSTTAANRRRNFGSALGNARRNHRHREFTYFHANSHRRSPTVFLLSSSLRRSFAFAFLTRVASRSPCHRRHVFCLSASPRKTAPRISIRRRAFTAFFRMPRGSSEAVETCRGNRIFSTTFPAFSTPGRVMHPLHGRRVYTLSRTYLECESSFTTITVQMPTVYGLTRRTRCTHE